LEGRGLSKLSLCLKIHVIDRKGWDNSQWCVLKGLVAGLKKKKKKKKNKKKKNMGATPRRGRYNRNTRQVLGRQEPLGRQGSFWEYVTDSSPGPLIIWGEMEGHDGGPKKKPKQKKRKKKEKKKKRKTGNYLKSPPSKGPFLLGFYLTSLFFWVVLCQFVGHVKRRLTKGRALMLLHL